MKRTRPALPSWVTNTVHTILRQARHTTRRASMTLRDPQWTVSDCSNSKVKVIIAVQVVQVTYAVWQGTRVSRAKCPPLHHPMCHTRTSGNKTDNSLNSSHPLHLHLIPLHPRPHPPLRRHRNVRTSPRQHNSIVTFIYFVFNKMCYMHCRCQAKPVRWHYRIETFEKTVSNTWMCWRYII